MCSLVQWVASMEESRDVASYILDNFKQHKLIVRYTIVINQKCITGIMMILHVETKTGYVTGIVCALDLAL